MFDACLPQTLRSARTGQLEPDGGLETFEFSRAYLDVKVVPLVRDFQNLGPGKPIDPQPNKEDFQTRDVKKGSHITQER